MCGLPETNLFAAENYNELSGLYTIRRRFQHGLLRAIAELGLGGQTEENIEKARAWLEENRSVSTADLFNDIIFWASPRHVVEKSPSHVFNLKNLERMQRTFPEARYIHLIRHPRGTCESVIKLRNQISEGSTKLVQRLPQLKNRLNEQKLSSTNLTPEVMWLKPHQNILGFLSNVAPELYIQIHGEDLMTDPGHHFGNIAAWLQIRTDDEAIAAMKHPEYSPFACLGPRNARFGNDPDFLEKPALRTYQPKQENLDDPLSWDPQVRFSAEVKDMARQLGY